MIASTAEIDVCWDMLFHSSNILGIGVDDEDPSGRALERGGSRVFKLATYCLASAPLGENSRQAMRQPLHFG
jgi:hypothetical protein